MNEGIAEEVRKDNTKKVTIWLFKGNNYYCFSRQNNDNKLIISF